MLILGRAHRKLDSGRHCRYRAHPAINPCRPSPVVFVHRHLLLAGDGLFGFDVRTLTNLLHGKVNIETLLYPVGPSQIHYCENTILPMKTVACCPVNFPGVWRYLKQRPLPF